MKMEKEKRFIIDESELKSLVEARAILDVIKSRDYNGYAEDIGSYLEDCIRDFGCNDMEEVVEKLIKEFEYKEI